MGMKHGLGKRVPGKKMGMYMKTGQTFLVIMGAVLLLGLSGSFSFGSNGTLDREGPGTVVETAMDREMAELVKLYRLCLQKHEDTPTKAKENCVMYKDAIREFAPDNLRTILAELLNGLQDTCEKSENHCEGDS